MPVTRSQRGSGPPKSPPISASPKDLISLKFPKEPLGLVGPETALVQQAAQLSSPWARGAGGAEDSGTAPVGTLPAISAGEGCQPGRANPPPLLLIYTHTHTHTHTHTLTHPETSSREREHGFLSVNLVSKAHAGHAIWLLLLLNNRRAESTRH